MRFLVPLGGVTDPAFGIFTSYRHRGLPLGLGAGLPFFPTVLWVVASETVMYLAGYFGIWRQFPIDLS
jgi:hypothetical protein